MVPNRLQELMELHFDSKWGAPFWVEQRSMLGFDPFEIRSVTDLRRFPPFPRSALVALPVQTLIPRRFHRQLSGFISCETGGTTGPAARTAFRKDEFHAAFIAPFLAAAEYSRFPRDAHWLYVGPSGPHPIGKAARLCASAIGSIDPFSVDFDPRWFRKLQGFARERYLEHVIEQALAILHTQDVGILFTTPPVIEQLADRLTVHARERIQGIHTGGIAPPPDFWKRLGEWFPAAAIMSGYGNSLAGMCPQLQHKPCMPPSYFPHGNRLIYEFLPEAGKSHNTLCFHRLDDSCFLPHVLERDTAIAIDPPPEAAALGFTRVGIQDPRPVQLEQGGGLY